MRMAGLFLSVALFMRIGVAGAKTPIQFTDVTEAWDIRFEHNNGAFGEKYLPETMGSGVAVFDADGNGEQDLFFVNGKDWEGHPTGRPDTPRLYLQINGTFRDRTKEAGLATPMYGLGVAVGDYDNDGDADLYLAALGPDRLYENNGDGSFHDVTGNAGIDNRGFSTSAAWFDYDGDGNLDLYVANYVEWSIETDIFCTLDGVNKSYCTPESYTAEADRLYRNNGDGTFEDVTERAGVYDPTGKSLGVVAFDANNDGRMDLFVSGDTEPNKLFENDGDGTFQEIGMLAGVAYDEAGIARAGMGVDAADFNRSGRMSLVVGNFSNQMLSLYRNEGNGLFIDTASPSQLGVASLLTLAFGCFFFDADGDGWLDLFVANGHVENEINRVQANVHYAERPHLFRNETGETFADVAAEAGLTEALVGRGAAYGDLDNDGDLDIVVTQNGGPARVYRNDSEGANLLRIRLIGEESNRDAIGARVTVVTESGTQQRMVKGGGSYGSQSERTLTFGLGTAEAADRVEVVFPSGTRESLRRVLAGQLVEVTEGRGITKRVAFARPPARSNREGNSR